MKIRCNLARLSYLIYHFEVIYKFKICKYSKMNQPREIKKLSEDVINRIAAGEVVQRPANALKELIENSLDAQATNIQIVVKNGGLKLLQIQDNGTGIRKEDFPIVCERFTTSKLKEFEDLNTISTYGFRGEALASISHIAHLSITSKTKNDICAYQGRFVDGNLQGNPKPTAGNQGTIITVEDLFYNMHVRQRALRSPAEEYNKIFEVVSKYAVHNAGIGFALKKHGENNDIRTPPKSTQIENIGIIYGNAITRELIEFSLEDDNFKFKAHGFCTNVNYSTKKFICLIFINHRLVDCSALKKCLDQVYSTYLPKNTHPFVYISLQLDPGTVDVNVHPTKHEVHFLNEDQIVDIIASAIEKKLLGTNNSRVFYTQAKLPGVTVEHFNVKDAISKADKSIQPKEFVRTDSSVQKLEKFFGATRKVPSESKETVNPDVSLTEDEFNKQHEQFLERNENFENQLLEKTTMEEDDIDEKPIVTESKVVNCTPRKTSILSLENVLNTDKVKSLNIIEKTSFENEINHKSKSDNDRKPKLNDNLNFLSKINRVETNLSSVLRLRKEIEENCHRTLRETFAQLVYVGPIDTRQALIQHNTKLFLCNTEIILKELFYQFILYNFQNFSEIVFQKPISLFDLSMICLDQPETGWKPEDGPKDELAQKIMEILVEKAEMLKDYFSLEIDETGHLIGIPVLIDDYIPDKGRLPNYIVRLATEVDWEEEQSCFQSFARETAEFYAQVSDAPIADGKDWKWVTEFVLFPAIRDYFIPPKSFIENAAILEIASLPNLYRVFERC